MEVNYTWWYLQFRLVRTLSIFGYILGLLFLLGVDLFTKENLLNLLIGVPVVAYSIVLAWWGISYILDEILLRIKYSSKRYDHVLHCKILDRENVLERVDKFYNMFNAYIAEGTPESMKNARKLNEEATLSMGYLNETLWKDKNIYLQVTPLTRGKVNVPTFNLLNKTFKLFEDFDTITEDNLHVLVDKYMDKFSDAKYINTCTEGNFTDEEVRGFIEYSDSLRETKDVKETYSSDVVSFTEKAIELMLSFKPKESNKTLS